MLVLEVKLRGKQVQYEALDEAIRTSLFIRNKTLRYWLDNKGTGKNDLQKQCAVLAREFEWANKLNSMARQAAADRAWFAISRFYANCKANKPGKKGFPKFKKHGHSVEYKTTGWQLSADKKYIIFTDGFKAGKFKLIGTRDLNFYQVNQIKRVRIVKRADGYHCQFLVNVERTEPHQPTGQELGIDVGLQFFYTDSSGATVENPRYLRSSEKALKRLHGRVSKKKKGSSNRRKAIKRLARKHLKVSRQRREFAVRTARTLVKSADLIAYENLQIRNIVKNHRLAKSISDAAWGEFIRWVEHFGKLHKIVVIAVKPHYSSQECSNCGERVQKTLSTRTHICKCGCSISRDHNAAKVILNRATGTAGQTETLNAWGEMHHCQQPVMMVDKCAR